MGKRRDHFADLDRTAVVSFTGRQVFRANRHLLIRGSATARVRNRPRSEAWRVGLFGRNLSLKFARCSFRSGCARSLHRGEKRELQTPRPLEQQKSRAVTFANSSFSSHPLCGLASCLKNCSGLSRDRCESQMIHVLIARPQCAPVRLANMAVRRQRKVRLGAGNGGSSGAAFA